MKTDTRKHVPSLKDLRETLTPLQTKILDQLWLHFQSKDEWPLTRMIYRDHGKAAVRTALADLGGSVLHEERDQRGRGRLHLSLLGLLLTSVAEKGEALLKRYLKFQRDLFLTDPEKDSSSSDEIGKTLNLSDDEKSLLGQLVWSGSMYGGSASKSKGSWSVGSMAEAEEYVGLTDFSSEVERWAFRSYAPGASVFMDQRTLEAYPNLRLSSSPLSLEKVTPTEARADILKADPFKRRYQVFVSSTYNDLIEERKHVMQALLVTKCIPSGMELFPAASTEQWELIKQVIDDCDYYVVIVAGRYGSTGPNGLSYTEMEYDYAVSIGKPVLGFFHSNILSLPGDRIEDSDEGRRRLALFTKKVKQTICHQWNSPEGLASALKTAVINAIETNPKPGWVRASSVPSWAMVESLQKRIAELEGRAEPQLVHVTAQP